jgi:hypothetical protein
MRGESLAVIVIPVHNRCAHTLFCLEALKWCLNLPEWRVVVVDDGSTDGTGESIAVMYPQVVIVRGSGDLFWTGGIVAGMRKGLELGATEFVWLNDDTETQAASIQKVVERVRGNPHQVVGASATVEGVPEAFSSLKGHAVAARPGECQRVDVLAGFLVAFSRQVVDVIGLPDAGRFPHYAGDSDFTRRAHNAGFELWVLGDAQVALRSFQPYPTVAEYFWTPQGLTLGERMHRAFQQKRSKFRFWTQFHLDRLYRGPLMGTLAFGARLVMWAWQIARAGLETSRRHKSL